MMESDARDNLAQDYKELKVKYADFCSYVEHRQVEFNREHLGLLHQQRAIMQMYLHVLEARAVLEKIDLT